MPSPAYKGRVLFIHGYTQNSSVFYAKTSALRKKLIKLGYKCVYLNGPCKLTPADLPSSDALSKFSSVAPTDSEETGCRSWWTKLTQSNDGVLLEDAISTIKDYIKNNTVIEDDDLKQDLTEDHKLPVMGVVGFSQGAALAGVLMSQFHHLLGPGLQFVVLYSGFKLDTSKKSGNEHYAKYFQNKRNPQDSFKVLHVLGELDTVVSEDRSMALYEYAKEYSTILKHPGGHFVPNSKLYVEHVTNWICTDEKKEEKKEDDLDDLLDMMDNIGRA
ncbi:Family of serine hydrolases 3 [Yamadazyma tenuis]|uniref:Serine hydrolase domain-containing protein n=1 Tax=Candida tenuis (strain ATCC 10573 / BCRC 21748 / CBS 615 / JCM 9827 / NBRC 10315 / NRRL Y-1498 / VKM Y-70) TaxID=590646 RepID=G3BDB2_CANTC|nr:uncharacterized protein CANTEDRAFT_111820 [Yamadazyma tenuis ATCC 10573]EGV60921.1 hypothetical protein CANTEDRAFT_111820 [Yamadazyma tenuis ATCC 10573]WEJ93808.1 Family of serine hydrolases 3 [Yamadazyma tenuis]